MTEPHKRLKRSGAHALTLGILTLVFGATVGVLGIVNGCLLLRAARKLH